MKSSLKVKLLQHLAAKKSDNAGFTLIELLVVIIIIGILSAIALPSFLNQANKAKQSEAKTYVGSLNRAQQAFYLENDTFVQGDAALDLDGTGANGKAITALGIGVPTVTSNYAYLLNGVEEDGLVVSITNQARQVAENPTTKIPAFNGNSALKAYIGGVSIDSVKETGEATTVAVLCGAEKSLRANPPGPDGAQQVTYAEIKANPRAACGVGVYEPLKK